MTYANSEFPASDPSIIAELRRRGEQLIDLQREEASGDAIILALGRHSNEDQNTNHVSGRGSDTMRVLTQAQDHYNTALRAVRMPNDLKLSPEREAMARVSSLIKGYPTLNVYVDLFSHHA